MIRHFLRASCMLLLGTSALHAQQPRSFGDLAGGPYNRLVIRGAMVIPGHGGPPAGPYDILIEGNTITPRTFSMSSERPIRRPTSGMPLRPHGQS